jgi:hypothetical protein
MPTPTYTALATVTLGGSDTEIVFSSIPQSYRDLVVVIGGSANAGTSPSLRFNNDSGSNYNIVRMYANGSTYSSQSFNATYGSVGFMNTEKSTVVAHIMDYSATDKHKTALGRSSNTDTLRLEIVRWANTSAITTLEVRMDGGSLYSTGTVMSLYGIAG